METLKFWIMLKSKIAINIVDSIEKSLNKRKNERIYLHEPYFNKTEISLMNKCIKKNSVSTAGFYTKEFEEKIKLITKAKYATATINGTSALHLALLAIGIKKNDEILIPALNFIASANACLYVGATPHFIDIESKTLGVNFKKLKEYLSKNTKLKNGYCLNKKTKKPIRAIMLMHTFGHPNNLKDLRKIIKKFNLRCIEDAAEGLGSYYKKKHVGTFGDIGMISFNGNKIITTGGGGVLITNNKKYALEIEKLATINKKKHPWKYEFRALGYNYKMPSLNAALGLAQLKKLNNFIKIKRRMYVLYKNKFSKNEYFELFAEPKNCKSNYWLQTIIINKNLKKLKDKIINLANKKNIMIRPVWKPVNKLKYLKDFPKMNLDTTNDLENRIINIPSGPSLEKKMAKK
tara:strand:+ start:4544 stop:5758 length:1215 start_codon:yes stop_codon:yes gene_type:complete